MLYLATYFIPETLGGWALVVSAFAVTAGTIISSIMFVMKQMLKTLETKIDGIRLNQRENTDATLRAVQRVQDLEVTINNGLTHQAEATRRDVDIIKAGQTEMKQQLGEIHGWMRAMREYDGTDRRNGD